MTARHALLAIAAAASLAAAPAPTTTIRLVGFTDYHSHALPFVSEGRPGQGGIARVIAYVREARRDPRTIVVSGGDTMNAGSPTWSDEYRCVEWPWWNGLVDAMALGNHDLDYGADALAECRGRAGYPVLAANLRDAEGRPVLLADGKPYVVKEVSGLRIGLFAVAGADFQRLVSADKLPAGERWTDPITAAREVVTALREQEHADAVVLIGHEHAADDEALVAAVPGIDLVLGTHSHLQAGLAKISGTSTWRVSPYQYLAYVADVALRFEGRRLVEVTGGLVAMDESRPEDARVAADVARLQRELVGRRPDRFRVLGRAATALTDLGVTNGESLIGNWATEELRRAASVQAFFSTASSFRGTLPDGDVTVEDLFAAIPYRNTLVTATVTGRALRAWLALCVSKAGSDGFCQESGLRYAVGDDGALAVAILKDAARPAAGFVEVDDDERYRIGTTDFQAYVAAGYKELFAAAAGPVKTGIDAHEVLEAALAAGPVHARLDGRARVRQAPVATGRSGSELHSLHDPA